MGYIGQPATGVFDINDNTVTTQKILDGTITSDDIASGSIQQANLASGAGNDDAKDASQDANIALLGFLRSTDHANSLAQVINGWSDVLNDQLGMEDGAASVPMVRFDGANDRIAEVTTTVGITDGKQFTVSFLWDATNSIDGNINTIVNTSSNKFRIWRNVSNKIEIQCLNLSSGVIVAVASTNTVTASDGLVHIAIAMDLSVPTLKITINGIEETNIETTLSNDTVDIADGSRSIEIGNDSSTGGRYLKGDLGQFYFAEEYVDISNSNNIALFYDSVNSVPVDLGSDGSKPTGTAPIIFLNNLVPNWHTNKGSGSDIASLFGELVDAGTLTTGLSDGAYNAGTDTFENSYELIDSYGKENADSTTIMGSSNDEEVGECITLSSPTHITKLAFQMYNVSGAVTGNIFCHIYSTTGTVGVDALPDGNILEKSSTVLDASTVGTATPGDVYYWDFSGNIEYSGDIAIMLYFEQLSGAGTIRLQNDVTTGKNRAVTTTFGSGWSMATTSSVPFYLYGLKNLNLTTVSSTDLGNSPSVAPTTGHFYGLIQESGAGGGGSSVWSDVLDAATGYTGYTVRTVLPNASISNGGSRCRVRLQGGSTESSSLDNVAIVERSGATGNGIETPTQLLFGGTSGCLIPLGGSLYSDWLDFTIDASKDYLMIFDVTTGTATDELAQVVTGGGGRYFLSGSNSYNTAAMPAGYSENSGYTVCINLLEVSTDLTLGTDIEAFISTDGTDPVDHDEVTLTRDIDVNVGGTTYQMISGSTALTSPSTNLKATLRTTGGNKIITKAINLSWS